MLCKHCESLFINVRLFIDHIPTCKLQSKELPKNSVIHLTPFARQRYIDTFIFHCYDCAQQISINPVDDYLVCPSCHAKNDLLVTRHKSKRIDYIPSPQFDLFGSAL